MSTPEPSRLSGAVEALLLMAEEPVAAVTLAEAVGAPLPDVAAVLTDLSEFYDTTGRGFELRHVAGGWRLYTRPEHAPLVSAWVLQGQQSRLSTAALETLAVVAYLQPISRSRVSAVRGVNVDGVMRTLQARGLIEEAGADEGGGAMLFTTTSLFLEKLGLTSLDELPALAPHLPEAQALEAELTALAQERAAETTGEETPGVDEQGSPRPAGQADGEETGTVERPHDREQAEDE